MLVRALRTHTQPGSGTYRIENEEFEHQGKLYKHVEPVKRGRTAPEETRDAESTSAE